MIMLGTALGMGIISVFILGLLMATMDEFTTLQRDDFAGLAARCIATVIVGTLVIVFLCSVYTIVRFMFTG